MFRRQQALSFFLNKTALDAKATAAIEAHFRTVHEQRVAALSLEDIETLLGSAWDDDDAPVLQSDDDGAQVELDFSGTAKAEEAAVKREV